MYPANATEVSAMVQAVSDGETKWLIEQPGGLTRWLENKGVGNAYTQPRVYQLQDKEPVSEKKIVITT